MLVNYLLINIILKLRITLKLYNYLDKLGFKGKIINYEIETNKRPNKNLDFINCKNSGEVIFHFLNPKHNIDIYGMYNCLDDNLIISKLILNKEYINVNIE